MGVRENKVERYLKSEVKKLGGITRKWVSPMHVGVPDQIVIVKGFVVFAELKTVDGESSSAQERETTKLTEAGANVVVLFGKEGVDDFINTMKGVLENVDNNDSGGGERLVR
jgi:hypothetical protein